MGASAKTKILLAFRSGDRCALRDCGQSLTIDGAEADAATVGEAAHIVGENLGAARYDATVSDEVRNGYSNLIYVCGTCHIRIDKQEADFSTDLLRALKLDHEATVRRAIQESFADIGFPELEEATRWIFQISPGAVTRDFALVRIDDKLRKNELTNVSRVTVAMGLSVAGEVQSFVESVSQTDENFPDRLKSGFLEEYYRLRREGHSGDDLFDMMCCFAQRGCDGQAKKSAALAVLIYLLESCEVFEK